MSTCEQQTAIDLVNLICFLPTVSSDYTDFVREFEQNRLKKLTTPAPYLQVQVTFPQGRQEREIPT